MVSSSIYLKIYTNLCETRKFNHSMHRKGSGLHVHHIIPRHCGGTDDDANLTYLTVREHIIAHFLLWKIHGLPNDLRSMKMLGAKLTVAQRKIIGQWCRDNKIGIHGATPQQKTEWRKRGLESQQKQQGSFAWWASPEGRKLRASMGGKASANSPNHKNWSHVDKKRMSEIAKKGNRNQPKKPANNGVMIKKFYTDQEREEFIANNPSWTIGHGLKPRLNKKSSVEQITKQQKKVTDGSQTFSSVKEAASAHNVTSSAIVCRCKSKNQRWVNWQYVFDT